MSVAMPDGQVFSTGEARTPFSIQSISKLFSLELAMRIHGDAVWSPIGKEPSGASFNLLVLLEHENPRDPFINAGALAIIDLARRDAQRRKTRVQLPSIQAISRWPEKRPRLNPSGKQCGVRSLLVPPFVCSKPAR
jgi:glutaminase